LRTKFIDELGPVLAAILPHQMIQIVRQVGALLRNQAPSANYVSGFPGQAVLVRLLLCSQLGKSEEQMWK